MLEQSTMKAAVEEVCSLDAGVQRAAIVSHDGLIMVASDGEKELAETLAAIASELLGKGRLATEELHLGHTHSQMVFGEQGGVMLRYVNEEMVLVVLVGQQVNVGRTAATLNRIATSLAQGF